MPYIIVNDAVRFVRFVKEVFDAKELSSVPSQDDNDIMHAELSIGNAVIMLASAGEDHKTTPAHLFVYVPNTTETCKKAVALGAKPVRNLREQEYGRNTGFLDPFGNTWWLTTPE